MTPQLNTLTNNFRLEFAFQFTAILVRTNNFRLEFAVHSRPFAFKNNTAYANENYPQITRKFFVNYLRLQVFNFRLEFVVHSRPFAFKNNLLAHKVFCFAQRKLSANCTRILIVN